MRPLPADLAALAAGGKGALAHTLSALETSPEDPGLVALLDAALLSPRGIVLGLTGPPGVGKSTLANALVARLRAQGATVAVIAVDPSSRLSGGALLGDRTRIDSDPADAGTFVRSMAARRRLGGVADVTWPAAVLLRALFDQVIVETVGVGQSESEIAECADLVVFCAQPGSGDALQFMKAGITEVPDLVLVTKGDLGAPARRAAADLRGALSLSASDGPPADVAVISALTGEGLDTALEQIAALAERHRASGALDRRRAGQARTWAESQIAESFGRVGLSLIGPRLSGPESVFAAVATLRERARAVLHETLKNI
jgi:LAO/AO transport system kinase